MKANKKSIDENNKKAGVSAVIGVILMVAITVAIACTVYVYVRNIIGVKKPNELKTGNIIYIPIQDTWKNYDVLILNNLSVYKIFSISHSDYQILKFAYNYNYTVYFEISYSWNDDISIVENSVNILNR